MNFKIHSRYKVIDWAPFKKSIYIFFHLKKPETRPRNNIVNQSKVFFSSFMPLFLLLVWEPSISAVSNFYRYIQTVEIVSNLAVSIKDLSVYTGRYINQMWEAGGMKYLTGVSYLALSIFWSLCGSTAAADGTTFWEPVNRRNIWPHILPLRNRVPAVNIKTNWKTKQIIL